MSERQRASETRRAWRCAATRAREGPGMGPARAGARETTARSARQENDMNEILKRAHDALVWCSGSGDFQEEGKARKGWLKVVKPVLDDLTSRLAATEHPTRADDMSDADYRALYGRDDWYRRVPDAERQSDRDKWELLEHTPWIPWKEAPPWTLPFRLNNGHIRAVGAWREGVYYVRIFGRYRETGAIADALDWPAARGSVWDGASPPAIDAGAMLASLMHDAIFAAHRAGLLGDETWRQSVRLFVACNRRFGRMLAERTRCRRERDLPTPGIERLGNARNVWARIGLGVGGWRAWTRPETEAA